MFLFRSTEVDNNNKINSFFSKLENKDIGVPKVVHVEGCRRQEN
jgi:hypothetical protein